MRVIITGGTGLIGRALWRPLIERGDEVVVLTRSPEKARDLPGGVRAARWDARTGDDWHQEITDDCTIVNLAGESLLQLRWTETRKRRITESRVHAGEAVIDAIRQSSKTPAVLVQASGVNYYGVSGNEPSSESTPPGDDFLASVCVRWEESTAEAESLGVRRAIIRSGVVLDPGSPALRLMALPFRFFVGGSVGSGKQVLNWIHLQDEVRAIIRLIEDPSLSGPFNLTAPTPTTNEQFSRALGRVLGRPSLIRTPAFPLRLALGEMAYEMVLEGQYARPARLQEAEFDFHFPEIEPALRDALNRS